MAGQVFAIASGKGGVGKTTTVVNLGVVLRRADHSVALVDADLGMANLGPMLGVSGELTLHDVLAGESTVKDALVEEAPGFAVLPGSDSLTDYPDADPKHLGAVLEILAESYDFVLVDTGAGMSHEDVLPLGLADHVVLVTSPDPAAIGDTRKTAELAGLAEGDVAGLLVTKADAGTDAEHVASQVGVDLLGVIPYDPTVRESTASGRPLEAIDPDTPAATAYRELANALADGSADPLAEAPAADFGADSDEPPEAVSPADPEGSEDSEPADATEAPAEPAAAAADEEPSAAESVAPPEAADDELPMEGGDVEPDAEPDEAEPPATGSEDEAETDDEASDVASDEAEPTEEPEVEAPEDEAAEPTETSEAEASKDEEAEPAEEPEVEASEDEEAEPTEEPEVEASEDEEPGTDEEEADEEDYLAEFEDDEPESKGGILSRIRRLFR